MYEIINTNIIKFFNNFECHEYICIIQVITSIFLFLLIIYKINFHNYNINNLLNKITKINIIQILFLLSIVLFTFIFSYLRYNTNNNKIIGVTSIIFGIILFFQK